MTTGDSIVERLRRYARAARPGNLILTDEDAEWFDAAANEIESRRIDEQEMIREKREDARWEAAR